MLNTANWQRDLVLVGGGHAHALILKMMAMRPRPGVRTTLVSLADNTPYSGMLPGLVAGHYNYSQVHIDLRRLCAGLGVRFITGRVNGIDLPRQEISLSGRPALAFDAVSFAIGSQPDLEQIPGAREYAVPVKPVHDFYQRWQNVRENLKGSDKIVLVGGGASSVELALAMAYKLAGREIGITLICGRRLLDGYAESTRARVLQYCRQASITVSEADPVVRVSDGTLTTGTGVDIEFDQLFWCTSAVAETWLAESELQCDTQGFLQVRDTLQLLDHDNIFAAGDIATQVSSPSPKAGVYAVRQAPYLAHNLSAFFAGSDMRCYTPQDNFLSLLSVGDKTAVAEKSWLKVHGSWVWGLKNYIDCKFMLQFNELPAQMPQANTATAPMHCGGCGAKVPGGILRTVLVELGQRYPFIINIEELADDAAAIRLPAESTLWQSVDVLRQFVDDPWLMGRITALHALSDLYAMGAMPHSLLAHITLPYSSPEIQARDLLQIMDGALHELAQESTRLIGGHTLEGPELSVGFTVNGLVQATAFSKNQLAEGDQLILCKPLGTGVLFAAQQQGLAEGSWITAALESMLLSNQYASAIALQHNLVAATDITGFGLLGHLGEMLLDGTLQAELWLSEVPLLDGVTACYHRAIESTLQAGNIAHVRHCLAEGLDVSASELQPLFDPQTSGGLLLAVPESAVNSVLFALRSAAYPQATAIGRVKSRGSDSPTIRIQA